MITVLYVDDEQFLLDIGKRFLEKMGDFKVELVDSAVTAIDKINTIKYDAIVSDYQMPKMDGLEFLKQVRLIYGQIPFILFTGRGREEIVIEAINLGVDFYLQKGGETKAQFAELALKIRQAVQRRRAEISHEESERRYREVVETQTDFISRFKPDGTHVFANDAYCRYFGKRHDEIIGHRFLPNIPEPDMERIRKHFASFSPDNPIADIEHRVIMPDGSIRWHWWNDHAIFDDMGRVVEYQSIGKDITERKQAEEAVKNSENLYRTIFATTGTASIIIEEDTTITLANAGFAALSGYTIDELQGKRKWTEFVVNEDLERMKKYHYERRSDPPSAPMVYEFRFVDRFGNTKYCINNVAMIPDTKRSVASVLDITNRVLAEKDYYSIFENIQEVFYRTDAEGRLILASPSGASILGYESIDEIYGINIAKTLYVNPAERQEFLTDIDRTGSVSNFEVKMKKEDGSQITIITSSHKYFDTNGNFLGIEGVLRDITERKLAEEEIRKSENLYRTIFATTGTATIIIEEDTTIALANAGFATLSGYTIDELEGKRKWTEFVVEEDLERMKKYHFERHNDPESAPRVYEFRFIDRFGNIKYCLNNVAMIPGTSRSVASILDLTNCIPQK